MAAVLLARAIGDRLNCIFVDHGMLRLGEFDEVMTEYRRLGLNVKGVDASEKFFSDLAGVTDSRVTSPSMRTARPGPGNGWRPMSFSSMPSARPTAALRAVTSTDAMTADWAHLPYEFLAKVSNEIINKVRGVNRSEFQNLHLYQAMQTVFRGCCGCHSHSIVAGGLEEIS